MVSLSIAQGASAHLCGCNFLVLQAGRMGLWLVYYGAVRVGLNCWLNCVDNSFRVSGHVWLMLRIKRVL